MPARLKSNTLRLLLMLVIGILLGALYSPLHRFLNQQVDNTLGFFAGHPLEAETTAWQKVENDLGIAPWRSTRAGTGSDPVPFDALRVPENLADLFPESSLEIYLDRGAAIMDDYAGMLIKTQVDSGRGYSPGLLLVGFDGALHKWIPLDGETECECASPQPLNYFHIDGDPSRLQTDGNRLLNLNSCGAVDWTLDSRYGFHHYLNNDGDHRHPDFWILDATDLVQVETASGRVLQRIGLEDVINANPDLPIFEARLKGTRPERWVYGEAGFAPIGRTHSEVENADPDPFHTNDIDSYLGETNGVFENGDLVLSFRSLNLIAVLRPATLQVVWYAYGLSSRQHDPDFLSADSIMIYDNNFHGSRSRITKLTAAAAAEPDRTISTGRGELVSDIEGRPFHQLIEGYQFYLDDRRSLVLSAESHNFGVDTSTGELFFAFRHRWRDQAFLAVDIERFLGPGEFAQIRNAACR